jgi:hypothetical protein
MKVSLLSLTIATVAFAGSSIYFWSQLENERARADELIAQSRKLNERLVELEKARDQFSQRRFAGAGSNFSSAPMAQGGPAGAPPPAETGTDKGETPPGPVWQGPQRTPAFLNTMRNQARAGLKRTYADIGKRLGLSNEQADKLLDLLAEQQSRDFERTSTESTEGDTWRALQELREKNQSEIADLIGTDKVQALQKYQEAMPARMELEMIAGQLEGAHAALSEVQSNRMLDMMVDERARVPQPQFDPASDAEDMQKKYLAWEADYNDRVATQAHSILNSEQVAAYDEYQQFQKEMRQQVRVFQSGEVQRTRSAPGISFSTVTMPASGVVATPAQPVDKKPN